MTIISRKQSQGYGSGIFFMMLQILTANGDEPSAKRITYSAVLMKAIPSACSGQWGVSGERDALLPFRKP